MCSIDCHHSGACENTYLYFYEDSSGMIAANCHNGGCMNIWFQSWTTDPTQSPTSFPTLEPTSNPIPTPMPTHISNTYWNVTTIQPAITCALHQSCTIICNAYPGSCENTLIICPEDATCDVRCVGVQACWGAKIQWPIIPGYGHLTCEAGDACRNVTFPNPNPTQALSISCIYTGSCMDSKMYCPTSANCTLNCGGILSCPFVCIKTSPKYTTKLY